MKSQLLGIKYFNDDEVIRIVRTGFKKVTVIDDATKEVKIISKKDLISHYTKLLPIGIVESFASYNGKKPDLVFKYKSISKREWDLISSLRNYTGCVVRNFDSMSMDTFHDIMNKSNRYIRYGIKVAYYLDDGFDTISTVWDFHDTNIRKVYEKIIEKFMPYRSILPDESSKIMNLKRYLQINEFWQSIDEIYDIHPIVLHNLIENADDGIVLFDTNDLNQIQQLYTINLIVAPLCVRYWYDIQLNRIANSYILIRDQNTEGLFILKYIDGGPDNNLINGGVFSPQELDTFMDLNKSKQK